MFSPQDYYGDNRFCAICLHLSLFTFAALGFSPQLMARNAVPSDNFSVWCLNCSAIAFSYNGAHQLRKWYDVDEFFLLDEILVVVYLTGNHSCEPNAEVTFPYNNSTLALKALSSIQRGEVLVLGSQFINV